MHSRKGLLPTHKPMTLPENQTVELKFDIDHQNWAERLLVGENRLLEMIAKGNSLTVILDGLCRLVEEISSDTLATILLLDGNRLWHAQRLACHKATLTRSMASSSAHPWVRAERLLTAPSQ